MRGDREQLHLGPEPENKSTEKHVAEVLAVCTSSHAIAVRTMRERTPDDNKSLTSTS